MHVGLNLHINLSDLSWPWDAAELYAAEPNTCDLERSFRSACPWLPWAQDQNVAVAREAGRSWHCEPAWRLHQAFSAMSQDLGGKAQDPPLGFSEGHTCSFAKNWYWAGGKEAMTPITPSMVAYSMVRNGGLSGSSTCSWVWCQHLSCSIASCFGPIADR